MEQIERKASGLACPADNLRKLILDNPSLPLLVFAGEDANCGGDYSYMSCSRVNARIGEFLDCTQTVNDERVYTNRDDFQEDMENRDYEFDGSEQEVEQYIENKMLEYEPYWKPCIILYVDN